MTAIDHETGENIINPYIKINNRERNVAIFLNTSTFKEQGQDLLLRDCDYEQILKIGNCLEVWAIIGNYNISKSVSFTVTERCRSLLGKIDADKIKEYLPNSYRTLMGKD